MKSMFLTLCVTGLVAAMARPVAAAPLTFDVIVNTASLIGNAAGPFSLDFQLNGAGPNTAVISNFFFGGGSAVGAPVAFGGASGSLTSGITLSDASTFSNELFQQFIPGTKLSFRVVLTANVTPTPDAFSFAILDGNTFNIPTSGLGDSLALVNITKTTLTVADVQTFSGLAGTPNYSGVTASAAPVPEPASVGLLSTGIVALVARRRRRRGQNRTV